MPLVRRLPVALVLLLAAPIAATAQSKPAAPAKTASGKPVWPDEGPRTWAPRPTVAAITANDLRTRLYGFADDSMTGRRIGEIGNFKATDYIAREFKRFGLKPGGENGGYFQDLPYGPIGFEEATSRLTAGGTTLAQKTDWIPIVPTPGNGLSAKLDLNNVPTVFAGVWGDTTAALDPALVRGKVAVFIAGATSAVPVGAGGRGGAATLRCDSVPDKFGAAAAAAVEAAIRADSAAGRGGRGGAGRAGGAGGGRGAGAARDARAQTAGALAVILIALDSVPTAAINTSFSGRSGMQPATAPGNPNGIGGAAITSAAAAKLFGKPVSQLTPGAPGQPISASWSYAWRMSKTPARNVIAILPGSDPARAAEYVLVGAHNDHNGVNATAVDHDSLRAVNWVTRRQGSNDPSCRPTAAQQHQIDSLIARARSIRPPQRDSIMNGADDDGSGTVVLLEIAEQFVKEKPARSIIFISHQGEEAGLLGSRWFTDHPTIPLKSIAAAHNMDMVGKGRVEYVKFGGPTSVQTLGSRRLSREFGDIIDSVNATRQETMAIDKTWDVFANPMNRFCRSDQVNYVRNDVPVTYFSTGYSLDYHQPTDEPRYVDYEHSARLGRFVHDVMMAVANRKDRPLIVGADPNYPACR